ncbi:MAG: DUF1998 domain-containing protein [Pseudomonadota bacterium]
MSTKPRFIRRADGDIRRSQVLTTGGAGALVDLLNHAVMIKGPDSWRYEREDEGFIEEERLESQALAFLKRCGHWPRGYVRLRRPPVGDEDSPRPHRGMHAREFPAWYLCRSCDSLVKRDALDAQRRHICTDDPKARPQPTVPIRFVNACVKGHIQDIDWRRFVHRSHYDEKAHKPYWCLCNDALGHFDNREGYRFDADLALRTQGTSGELNDLVIICRRCGASRGLQDLMQPGVFGKCSAWRPWLRQNDENCEEEARLLIRTGSNAWFPLQYSVLSIPEPQADLKKVVARHWPHLEKAKSRARLEVLVEEFLPAEVVEDLQEWSLDELWSIIERKRAGELDRAVPIRQAEWEEIMMADPGSAHDMPPKGVPWWPRRLEGVDLPGFIDRVVLIHSLREVRAQIGFTRLEGFQTGPEGTVETDFERVAPLSLDVDWIPSVEIRGEGIFLALDEGAVRAWEARDAVVERERQFREGLRLENDLKTSDRSMDVFTSARLVMLHSLAHMLITAISLEAGYSAAAIRERIYCYRAPVPEGGSEDEKKAAHAASRAGILLYTGTPGSEGTLGGLIEVGRDIVRHLRRAVEMNELCSNDPVCSKHRPDGPEEGRRREGAACHACLLIAEPSCERMNRDLDRALVVPTVEAEFAEAAFLGEWVRETAEVG